MIRFVRMALAYFRAIFSEFGSLVTGAFTAPLVVVAIVTQGIPRIVSAAFAVLCWFLAGYFVWVKEHRRAEELEARIIGFPLIRVAPDGFHSDSFVLRTTVAIEQGTRTVQMPGFSCLRLRLINEPRVPTKDAVAEGVRATIVFKTSDGKPLFSMDGRWADSPQQSERDRSKDISEILAVKFHVGQARNLDVVFKRVEDETCYGVNNDNFAPGVGDPRLPQRALPKGITLATVRVQAPYVDCSISLTFANEGAGKPLRALDCEWKDNLTQCPTETASV